MTSFAETKAGSSRLVGPPTLGYNAAAVRAALMSQGLVDDRNWLVVDEIVRQQGTTELRAVLDLGLVGEEPLADLLSEVIGATRWTPKGETGVIASAVSRAFMASNAVLVLEEAEVRDAEEGGEAVRRLVIIADPSDFHSVSALLARFEASNTQLAIGTQKEIAAFLEENTETEDASREGSDVSAVDVSQEVAQLRDMASEAPVIRFFNQVVERAMELGASDIHLERFDKRTDLRLRVDGILLEQTPPPLSMHDALLCRIKIMAGLDIAERRRAQDGRIRMRLRGRNVDMRVSIVPTMYGQDSAIRLQDRQRLASVTLEDLGFGSKQIENLYDTAAKSHGILLITGPTGSGKTTTLYAILRQLVTTERKVMTVEDPVEYAMDGVNQIPVNPAIDLTFSNTLRHILRHDPDVILVGEIRDHETAEMAFQASLTGHMVLSTLHTNDVPGSFVRLVDMGIEPFLVNAAVEGVSAQRLLRTLQRVEPGVEPITGPEGTPLRYRGRAAVMEFSPVTSALKQCMLEGAQEGAIRAAIMAEGFEPMAVAAKRLVSQGVTDEDEVRRVLGASAVAAWASEG